MVAVILVNFNGAVDTIECIKSLDNVKTNDYVVIIVDNHSSDDSVTQLRRVQKKYRFVLLEACSNEGFSAGNNIGIKYALKNNADYFVLLNNDTVVEPDFLEHLINGIQSSERYGAVTGKILYYSKPDTIWYAGGGLDYNTARSEHYNFDQKDTANDIFPQKVSFASGCCLCFSKNLVEKVGVLNEEFFLYEEDVEYCYRITKAGYDIVYIPSAVIYHKVSASIGQESPMSQYYMVRNKYYFIYKNFSGRNKITAYLYCSAQFIFRCLKKEQHFNYYIAGVKAFLRKETGKAMRELK